MYSRPQGAAFGSARENRSVALHSVSKSFFAGSDSLFISETRVITGIPAPTAFSLSKAIPRSLTVKPDKSGQHKPPDSCQCITLDLNPIIQVLKVCCNPYCGKKLIFYSLAYVGQAFKLA